MGDFGRLRVVSDLPDEPEFAALIRQAMAMTDSGAKPQRAPRELKPEIAPPDDLLTAIAAAGADGEWREMPPGCRREYLEWIADAKRPQDTRQAHRAGGRADRGGQEAALALRELLTGAAAYSL